MATQERIIENLSSRRGIRRRMGPGYKINGQEVFDEACKCGHMRPEHSDIESEQSVNRRREGDIMVEDIETVVEKGHGECSNCDCNKYKKSGWVLEDGQFVKESRIRTKPCEECGETFGYTKGTHSFCQDCIDDGIYERIDEAVEKISHHMKEIGKVIDDVPIMKRILIYGGKHDCYEGSMRDLSDIVDDVPSRISSEYK